MQHDLVEVDLRDQGGRLLANPAGVGSPPHKDQRERRDQGHLMTPIVVGSLI
jgi:hypothetical protein